MLPVFTPPPATAQGHRPHLAVEDPAGPSGRKRGDGASWAWAIQPYLPWRKGSWGILVLGTNRGALALKSLAV